MNIAGASLRIDHIEAILLYFVNYRFRQKSYLSQSSSIYKMHPAFIPKYYIIYSTNQNQHKGYFTERTKELYAVETLVVLLFVIKSFDVYVYTQKLEQPIVEKHSTFLNLGDNGFK